MFPHPRLNALGATGALLLLAAAPVIGASPSASPAPSPLASPVLTMAPSPAAASPSPLSTPCPDPSASPLATLAPSVAPAASLEVVGVASPVADASARPSTAPSPTPAPCTPVDPKVGMGVGPSHVLLGADQLTGSFSVYNAGDLEEDISLTALDQALDGSGTTAVGDIPLPAGAAEWLTFDPPTFVLQPEESRTVTFSVAIPADATPGDHVARIQVVGGFTQDAWARYYRDHPSANALTFKSRVAFGVDVITRVEGEIIPRVVVPPFEAFLPNLVLSQDGELALSPTIINQGNVAAVWTPVAGKTTTLADMVPTLRLKATGGLFAESSNLFEGTVGEDGSVNLSTLIVLPGATHTQRLTMTDAPLFGTYDYLYTLPGNVADGRETITRTGSFTVINVQKVVLWIVLPLALLLLLGSLVAFRRHRVGNQRRMAAALRARELQLARQEAYEQAWREQQAARGHHPR